VAGAPVIDDHAHPFPLVHAPLELDRVSLALDDGQDEAARQRAAGGRVFQELCLQRLGALLGAPADAEDADVLAAREAAAADDWGGYVRRLFDDASITGMVLDFGVPVAGGGGAGDYAELIGRPVWWLARIDPLVDRLVSEGEGVPVVVDGVERLMDEAVASGAIGFKTIVAYRSGLDVDPEVTLDSAEASLARDRDLPVRRRAKPLRDLVVRTVLERAADLGRPVQFHTGFGDSEIRLADANPLLLDDLLVSPAGRAATVVLIHGSHPFEEELAYLATARPNVYAELSLSNLFAPLGTADRLLRLVDLAPRHKLLAGSDGHGPPETHWFACATIRDGFTEVAGRLRAAGARERFVDATRRALFEENARAVYGLD
jgi:uncharacterized protein